MTTNRLPGRRALRTWPVACAVLLLAACVAEDNQIQARSDVAGTFVAQPRVATYDCGDKGAIQVENMRTAVRLVEASGDSYDLPASPPTQTSRYGEGGLALVIEGREALWMKAGKEPMTCRR